jgi:hypothetical protein
MLGLNAEDAMGLAEDMAVLRGAVRSQAVNDAPRPSSSRAAAALVAVAGMKALQVERDEHHKLIQKWNSLATGFSDLNAVAIASRAVIEQQIVELARVTGADPAEVRKATYAAMSQAYNAQVEEMISTGKLQSDPRKDLQDPKWKNRQWYSPPPPMEV